MGNYNNEIKYKYENLAINDYQENGKASITWNNTSDAGEIVLKDDFFGEQRVSVQKEHIDALEILIKNIKEYGGY